VHPHFWRQGLGQCLVEQTFIDARNLGYTEIELWCIKGNLAAQRLYEACGFEADKRSRTTTALTGRAIHEIAYRIAL
jgi:RimJ/RimL family protein N-acetyltransferase